MAGSEIIFGSEQRLQNGQHVEDVNVTLAARPLGDIGLLERMQVACTGRREAGVTEPQKQSGTDEAGVPRGRRPAIRLIGARRSPERCSGSPTAWMDRAHATTSSMRSPASARPCAQ